MVLWCDYYDKNNILFVMDKRDEKRNSINQIG